MIIRHPYDVPVTSKRYRKDILAAREKSLASPSLSCGALGQLRVETGHCVWCVSGAKTERVQLRRILDQLDAGDVFARDQGSTAWRAPPARLAIPRADTTTPHGRLMLTVLADLAEFERGLIRARTGEERERAKRRGVRFGSAK